MKRRTFKVLPVAGAIAALLAGGCQTAPQHAQLSSPYYEDDYLIGRTYSAADKLVELLREFNPADNVLVATFSDINDLNVSSPFGRQTSELFASRLSQHGIKVLNVKLRKKDIFIKPSELSDHPGEFMLSRNLAEGISAEHEISAVVVGTYSSTRFGSTTHVNASILKADDGTVLAAHNYSLDNREIQSLLEVAVRY